VRPSAVERILVYPMSGYINRLQTMASAALMAQDLGASVHYCWVPFPLVPGGPEDVFAEAFVRTHFVSPEQAQEWSGMSLEAIPRYVGADHHRGVAWLRGHDRGEQALLPELTALLEGEPSITTLVIVSGGSFALGNGLSAEARRSLWYRDLEFHPRIEERVAAARADHPEPYLALHLRHTDRALQAPSDSAVAAALAAAARESGLRSLFIAADTSEAGERWAARAAADGLEPWRVTPEALDRTDPRSAHGALVDWRLLGSAERLVYFAASSFASEAACAAGARERSIGLEPTALQVTRRRVSTWMTAAGRRLRRASHDR